MNEETGMWLVRAVWELEKNSEGWGLIRLDEAVTGEGVI